MSFPSPDYLGLLGLTLAIETAIVLLLAPRGRRRSWLAGCIAVNLASHPVASWIGSAGLGSWLVLEAGVVAFEATAYRLALVCPGSRALSIAAAANAVTAGLGLALA